ncbi:hypothetical protein BD626DRAFT_536445 [Schizophyllum amplum]|uniref:F-box domain-containing protein n=1 Tax=Schizophyllum amplum TaxID=97359 RepID=A0A550CI56_9AGAR|nr:hypothetical protein BD626DRAFT_536445 [Auriculariopsis ampla]
MGSVVAPPALRIPAEIQDIICHDETLQLRDLLHLAQVCQHWHAVAEAVAWEDVVELETLLRFMPRDAWEEPEGRYPPHCLNLNRRLTASDWEPTLAKSRYVKTLYLDFVSKGLQWSIMLDPPPRTLFPALRELHIDDSFEYGRFEVDCRFRAMLVPPTLRILRITSTYQDVCGEAASIVKCCRESITTVHVDNHEHNEKDRDIDSESYALIDLLEALQGCPHLSHVSLKLRLDKDSRLFEKLSQCPALVSLNIDLGEDDRLQRWLEGGAPKYLPSHFPALHHLHINGGSFLDAMAIIASEQEAPRRKIETIYVHAGHEDESGALRLFVDDLKKCDASTLRTVHIEQADWGGDGFQQWPLVSEHIEPLTMFSGLTYVHIGRLYGTTITDVDCAAMARAWPQLKDLSISIMVEHRTGTTCTLAALVPFARHCRHLRILGLPFNAISIPDATQPKTVRPAEPHASVIPLSLRVLYGAIADPRAVAHFLCELFPQRDLKVEYALGFFSDALTSAEDNQRDDRWKSVQALVATHATQLKENLLYERW